MRTPAVLLLTSALLFPAGGATAATPRAAASPTRSYIVTASSPSVLAEATASAARLGRVGHVYRHALTGFSVRLPAVAASLLRLLPGVTAVEPDRVFRISLSQPNASWALDRIDQRQLPLDTRYQYAATGAGVTAYVVDTGIRISHAQFRGRARNGIDVVDGDRVAQDCQGHGTHVAGSIGGSTFGVAKQVSLVAVRVLDCNGSGETSGIIAGLDWMVGDHKPGAPAVANLSLGGSASAALDAAVRRSIADGITVAIAAGNGNMLGPEDACRVSPARVTEAITVAASDRADRAASFSNYGACVDLAAPGVDIMSAGTADDGAVATMSGTSMAAPHVAGVATLVLQRSPRSTPAQVAAAIAGRATRSKVSGGSGGLLGLGAAEPMDLLFAGL